MFDLNDIQGNIHRPYGRYGFPYTRHLFFRIDSAAGGRAFVETVRHSVTTAAPWPKIDGDDGAKAVKPRIATNIGFTFQGLYALDLPTETLRLMPDEFIDGMRRRAGILGDVEACAPGNWDPLWLRDAVHIWVSINAGMHPDGSPLPDLDMATEWLRDQTGNGVTLLAGHGRDGTGLWQDSAALMEPDGEGGMRALPTEHFGFTDGISDPTFTGQFEGAAEALAVVGGGKLAVGDPTRATWSPLAAGEFILGQADEGQELPVATQPQSFVRNGTFMAYRKLEQDVAAFDADMARQASVWQAVTGCADRQEAEETVRAKIVGRWRSGLPLIVAPTWADHNRIMAEYADCIAIALRKPRDSAEKLRLAEYARVLTGFRYGDDPDGAACPFGAHIRRGNPRDMLDPLLGPTTGASTLTNRRRIMRRGLPYTDPDGRKGVVFMALCASLFRQFEFIQQQWMNYGLDFDAGNDSCPLVGSRTERHPTKLVIPAGKANATPVIAAGLPAFVVTRGGDYFFLPGLNALRMMAMGTIDPT